MAQKFHVGANGPGPCEAEERACPVGGEHGTKEQMTEVWENRMEAEHGEFTTVERHDSPLKQKLDINSLDVMLHPTEEGKKLFSEFREDMIKDYGISNEDLNDPSFYKLGEDGGMEIPAGEYYYMQTDDMTQYLWHSDNLEGDIAKTVEEFNEIDQKITRSNMGKLGVAGTDFGGKPAYYIPFESTDTFYQGNWLIEKSQADKFIEAGLFDDTGSFKVEKDTVFYGRGGTPSDGDEGKYFYGGDLTPEKRKEFDIMVDDAIEAQGDYFPTGHILNHPEIETGYGYRLFD